MKYRTFLVLCIVLYSSSLTTSQDWTDDDSRLGFLKLNSPFDSVLAYLGGPAKVSRSEYDANFTGFYFTKLIVWQDNRNNQVSSFHVSDPSFTTHRGLKIGDSLVRIQQHYGSEYRVVKNFGDRGAHDYSFRDYSQAVIFNNGDYHIAFFIKSEKLVKMVFYIALVLTDDDYRVGFLEPDAPFDSVMAHLGRPDSIKSFYDDDTSYTGFFYPKLVVWRDNQNKLVHAFDIYDSALATHRGLRIGDSVERIEELYGRSTWIVKEFSRVGPYDYTFVNYSEAIIFEGKYFFILFTKEQKLTKILFYVGVYDESRDPAQHKEYGCACT